MVEGQDQVVELGGMTWKISSSRESYWRDFSDVGRAVLTRLRDEFWGFCVRGPKGELVIPWAGGYRTAWECAEYSTERIDEFPVGNF